MRAYLTLSCVALTFSKGFEVLESTCWSRSQRLSPFLLQIKSVLRFSVKMYHALVTGCTCLWDHEYVLAQTIKFGTISENLSVTPFSWSSLVLGPTLPNASCIIASPLVFSSFCFLSCALSGVWNCNGCSRIMNKILKVTNISKTPI